MTQNEYTNSTNPIVSTDECRLQRFERNRYFHGKLMTARDMQAEQQYNRSQFATHARSVAGEGVVRGLDASVDATDDGGIRVTVESGYALDCCGRPIVVPRGGEETFDPGDVSGADRVAISIAYDECLRETVPVPGTETACDEQCAYNRVLEVFEIRCERIEPGEDAWTHAKSVPAVTFPSADPGSESDEEGSDRDPTDPALTRIARSFDAENGSGTACGSDDEHGVFLGVFARDENGTWNRSEDPARSRVYTNDMLYAAIARHTADFRNPHQVSLLARADDDGAAIQVEDDERPDAAVTVSSSDETLEVDVDRDRRRIDLGAGDGLDRRIEDRVGPLEARLESVEERTASLETRCELLERYVTNGTITCAYRTYSFVAETVDSEDAAKIVSRAESVLSEPDGMDPADYYDVLDEFLERERGVLEDVEAHVSDAAFERYEATLDELEAALDAADADGSDATSFLRVAVAQQDACDAARWAVARAEERRASLRRKVRAFTDVFRCFETDEAKLVAEEATDAIEAGKYVTEDAYRELVDQFADLEEDVAEDVSDRATRCSSERYERAVDALVAQLDAGDVADVVDAQNRVSDAAMRLVKCANEDSDSDDPNGDEPDTDDPSDDEPDTDDPSGDEPDTDDQDDVDEDELRHSLEDKQAAFDDVARRFHLDGAQQIAAATETRKDDVTTGPEYLEFVEQIFVEERALRTDLVGVVSSAGYERYSQAIEALAEAIDGGDVAAVVAAQNGVSAAAADLEPGDDEGDIWVDVNDDLVRDDDVLVNPVLRPDAYTVSQLETTVESISDPGLLQAMLEAEAEGKNRETATTLIERRLKDVSR